MLLLELLPPNMDEELLLVSLAAPNKLPDELPGPASEPLPNNPPVLLELLPPNIEVELLLLEPLGAPNKPPDELPKSPPTPLLEPPNKPPDEIPGVVPKPLPNNPPMLLLELPLPNDKLKSPPLPLELFANSPPLGSLLPLDAPTKRLPEPKAEPPPTPASLKRPPTLLDAFDRAGGSSSSSFMSLSSPQAAESA
jgi:hypothetical protein